MNSISNVKKNVLFVIVDDMNTMIGGYNGAIQAKTPNIDRLAASGILFQKPYCAAPYCNASRMSIFSGLRPSTSRVYVNEPMPLQSPPIKMLPEVFSNNGYKTFSAGKVLHGNFDYGTEAQTNDGIALWHNHANKERFWDESHDPTFQKLPDGRPFNSIFGNTARKAFPSIYHHFDWGPFEDPQCPDIQAADSTIEFLSQNHERPFFCAVGLYKPHLPWFAPKRFFELYPLDSIKLPFVKTDDLDDSPPIAVEFAFAQFDHSMIVQHNLWEKAVQAYLAALSYADEQIGRIIDALDESNYAHDTIVVFMSDNGYHLGQKIHWSKFALWEEACRVPLIFRLPGGKLSGTVNHNPASLLDVFPSLLKLCGLDSLTPTDGQSLFDSCGNISLVRSSPVISTWQRGNHSIRHERWRYTLYADGGEELFHHVTDPFEWHNLADNTKFAEQKTALRAALTDATTFSSLPPWFNSDWYLANNEDLRSAKVDPVDHFIKYGQFEHRPNWPSEA